MGEAELGTAGRPAVIGTRASALATTQTGMVARALEKAGLAVSTSHITTEGDTNRASLASLGGIGVFAARIRLALLDGECDIAVHSAKDLPAADAPGLTVAAYPVRENTADVLVAAEGMRLADLPAGACIGTGSPRRAAQILAARPDVDVVDIRGNVPTRLGRVRGLASTPHAEAAGIAGAGDLDGVILAYAGLNRLSLAQYVTDMLAGILLPAGAQGALAVEIRSEDVERADRVLLAKAVASLDHLPTRLEVEAERALLRTLGAGCAAPLGVAARVVQPVASAAPAVGDELRLEMVARVVSHDGSDVCEQEVSISMGGAKQRDELIAAARSCGESLAHALLDAGAADVADLHAARVSGGTQSQLWGD